MDKKELLRIITNLENKVEKSKILLYQKTDSLIESVKHTDQQDVIEKYKKELDNINKAFDKFLDSLKIE